jgi:hypothetical protein
MELTRKSRFYHKIIHKHCLRAANTRAREVEMENGGEERGKKLTESEMENHLL